MGKYLYSSHQSIIQLTWVADMQQKAEFAPLAEESETGCCGFMFSGNSMYELSACLRTPATEGHWVSSEAADRQQSIP